MCITDINPLLDFCITRIFSQLVFTLLTSCTMPYRYIMVGINECMNEYVREWCSLVCFGTLNRSNNITVLSYTLPL